jgi:translation initiation factor 3 subunit M
VDVFVFSGLSHEDCLQKMRVLTFMQISDGKSEISYETIEQELQLESDQVEAFIIDGLYICCLD